ncbi:Two-component system regulatory protein [Methylophaga thiooxydans]|uniref:Two-component system regulatory protein n=1 Tax=Methylophaga thiooxydans TaxID=392484 RepID=A0A0A0BGQ9_9GAMM|nr:response regulator transcription factor [Methylophaga thiooxydans]KGM07075.1 Two-component system regulatory protein [Methylophaga thiooxydans]
MKINPATVLIVEDHQDLAANIGDFLEAGGMTVDFAADGITALQLCSQNRFDAIVLDIMMPGIDGYEVCLRIRNELQQDMPIIMLTARDTLDDKLTGFEQGADDYLIKPFEMKELEARLISHIRRHRGDMDTKSLTIADMVFEPKTMRVTRSGEAIKLSPIMLQILRILMRESPNLVSREKLEAEIWGEDTPDSDTLRSHLYNLRKLIDKPYQQHLLHTIPGIGYKLCEEKDL